MVDAKSNARIRDGMTADFYPFDALFLGGRDPDHQRGRGVNRVV
jgi:hypothetical protein